MHVFELLYKEFGPQNWWPADTPFEVVVGAVLTQFVSWRNVEQAIDALKQRGLMDPEKILKVEDEILEELLKPTRFYKQKARRLKEFCSHLVTRYNGKLEKMFSKEIDELRRELLGIKGIGPETADSIILYAAEKPVFVIDAYTKRIFTRLGIFKDDVNYEEMQFYFHKHLKRDVRLFNEYHALIVTLGKTICSDKKPKCNKCPLRETCKFPNKDG
ncbi:MAG: endonuclease related protein [Thermosediminibacterales bacterium]|nr:endonuclease related protein [Thermosediminibacterales bacterium]